ncbi:TadE/TadG family type IV pilus assembly protein [Microbacterium arborescens]|uniref:TadE/TadG family type IV pilus assembly protein n=1 Tax=Microbacterium arborescens TaxID=33883 RepID=UPI003C72E701
MTLAHDERGSSPAEFVMVGALLTLLTLAVLQLGLAAYVRTVAHDAAVEGAYHAALADASDAEGAERAREIVERTAGTGFVQDARARRDASGDGTAVEVSLRLTLPLAGLAGVPGVWEVTGRAPVDDLD